METYETLQEHGEDPFKCGSPFNSYLFFIMFNILVMYVFLNLFLAIILDAFLG